jgi:NAD(P)-dependent dehydrogenase (short-subunit alcohol dehydrogenase family)
MEAIPWKQIRRQAKAQLATPSASFKGKTVLITGGNGSFAAGAAQIIVDHEVDTLILACRDVAKGEAVKKTIQEKTKIDLKPMIEVWPLDLASFESVRAFATKAEDLTSLDAVILNAGMFAAKKKVTSGGWELSE